MGISWDPRDPNDKPDNSPRVWLTGIAWLVFALLALTGLVLIAVRLIGG